MPADDDPARALLNLAHDFKALANPVRLRLLSLLLHSEICSCHVHTVLGISEAAARRQLSYLRRAKLVEVSQGTHWAYYRLAAASSDLRNRLLDVIAAILPAQPQFATDIEQLRVAVGGDLQHVRCGGK